MPAGHPILVCFFAGLTNGHAVDEAGCPLLRDKATRAGRNSTSGINPKQTRTAPLTPRGKLEPFADAIGCITDIAIVSQKGVL
jgi:hypothetical protein